MTLGGEVRATLGDELNVSSARFILEYSSDY